MNAAELRRCAAVFDDCELAALLEFKRHMNTKREKRPSLTDDDISEIETALEQSRRERE